MLNTRQLFFPGLEPFAFTVNYVELNSRSPENVSYSHSHRECEIYINLSGNVSFAVENRIYPISSGNVIITRPNEFHHCIYNGDEAEHRHFWILFSPDGNEALLRRFFDRPTGQHNLIALTSDQLQEARKLCGSMLHRQIDEIESYALFFRLLHLLNQGEFPEISQADIPLPRDTVFALNYIQEHLTQRITVTQIARLAHVSVNTLERHFSTAMQITLLEYLKRKRLSHAQMLLEQGKSVQETCIESGFSDYSHFIALFRRYFGTTPLQYQKQKR